MPPKGDFTLMKKKTINNYCRPEATSDPGYTPEMFSSPSSGTSKTTRSLTKNDVVLFRLKKKNETCLRVTDIQTFIPKGSIRGFSTPTNT